MRLHGFRPLLALVLALALTGCAEDEPETPTLPPLPTASVSAAPSPSPSPSPSMTEEQAVEAAVRFYFEGFNRALDQREAQELAKGSVPSCACRRAVSVLEEVLAAGAPEGNRMTLDDLQVADVDERVAVANVVYSTTPGQVLGPDGGVVGTLEAENMVRRAVFLTRAPEGWLVSAVEVLND